MRRPVVEPNFVDRLLEYFAPVRALDRLKARTALAVAGGYHGGRRDRRATRRWLPQTNSADADVLPDLPDLRSRARDLARNSNVATGAIATVVTGVVGDGLQLKPEIDHEFLGMTEDEATEWEQRAAREWQVFSKTADFTSVQGFNELQALVFRSALESGDLAVVRRFRQDFGDTYGTKLQLIEADRISNPDFGQDGMDVPNATTANPNRIFGGVEVTQDGRHRAYWVSDKHPGEINARQVMSWRRVPARARNGQPIVLHLYDRMRPDQSRGVPYLAPVIEALKGVSDYTEAEIDAAVVAAMFTVFVTSDLDSTRGPLDTASDATGIDPNEELALGKAAVVELSEGEKIEIANPSRPNSNFEPFMVAFLRQVGVALELPFELLIKHFTASYSASRAALEMAWQFFRRRRGWLKQRFCQPVYEWMIAEAVASGRLEAPGFFDDPLIRQAYCGCDWIGQARIQVDPLKEANADRVDVEMGVKSRDQVIRERTGGTFDMKHKQIVREQQRRTELVPTQSDLFAQVDDDDGEEDELEDS